MKTPYFVIHEGRLRELSGKLTSALEQYWPNYIVGYSFKTNSNKWLIEYMRSLGFFAEIVSSDEYELSQLIGYNSKVIYNGIAKSKETFISAITSNSIVNIDSWREIQWLESAPKHLNYEVGIRVNFDVESFCPGQSSGGADGGRFGFCYENGELEKAIKAINQNSNVLLTGIHLHCSSKTRSLDIYKSIASMAVKIAKEFELDLKYIDIGGGFFGGLPNKPGFEDYIKEVSIILNHYFTSKEVKLVVEPGMSLIGASVSYVSSIVDIKTTTYNVFVVTDGSRMHIDPLMRKTGYSFYIKKDDSEKRSLISKQVITGFTCMENDRLFELYDNEVLCVGDEIVYEKVGAYTMCLAPQFIQYLPAVYLEKDGKLILLETPWQAKDLIRKNSEQTV